MSYEPLVTMVRETTGVESSSRGPVGEELHALTARETIATATTVRFRRDIGDSGGVDETAD